MATLNEKIRDTIQMFRETLPREIGALLEQGAGEISALDIVERALKAGDEAPAFDLKRYGGGTGMLGAYLEAGPLVLTFYRGVWCPYCNLQLKEYEDRLSEIVALGANLVAITPEKPSALETLAASGAPQAVIDGAVSSISFDVLHDADNRVAKQFGLVFDLPIAHRTVLQQIGVDLLAMTGNETFAFADPATYVIAPDGRIFWAFVPNNYRKRAEVKDIKQALLDLKSINQPKEMQR